jgi:predicted glycogen debranching enzyme
MSVPDGLNAAPFRTPREICRDFERASRLEWLETNRTGAYAMGTVAGVNTRRYHALLIASLNPPANRFSILSRVEEQVILNSTTFELATVQYPSAVQPDGFNLLEEFRLDPFPVWRYQLASAAVEKTVCLLNKQQAVLVRYQTTHACRFIVRLFLSFAAIIHLRSGTPL